MTPDERCVVDPGGDLDLLATLRPMAQGTIDPTWAFDGPEVWRGLMTPDGPATMHFASIGSTHIDVEVWGPGSSWASARAAAMLGRPDSTRTLFTHGHPLMGRLAREHRGARVGASCTLVDSALPIIIGQRVTGGEAMDSWRRLTSDHGAPAPGAGPDRLRLPVVAERLAELGAPGLRFYGIDGHRASAMIQIARHRARLERLVAQPDGIDTVELTRVLSLIPGIGPWTRTSVLSVACGDPDAIILGDLHLPNYICWALNGERGSDDDMVDALSTFAPARGLAQRLIARHTSGPPRRGPRYRPLPLHRM